MLHELHWRLIGQTKLWTDPSILRRTPLSGSPPLIFTRGGLGQPLVSVSSRLKRTLARVIQTANFRVSRSADFGTCPT